MARSKYASVKWMGNCSNIYDGVIQKLNLKYIITTSPAVGEIIKVKWGRKIWTATFLGNIKLEETTKEKVQDKTTNSKTKRIQLKKEGQKDDKVQDKTTKLKTKRMQLKKDGQKDVKITLGTPDKYESFEEKSHQQRLQELRCSPRTPKGKAKSSEKKSHQQRLQELRCSPRTPKGKAKSSEKKSHQQRLQELRCSPRTPKGKAKSSEKKSQQQRLKELRCSPRTPKGKAKSSDKKSQQQWLQGLRCSPRTPKGKAKSSEKKSHQQRLKELRCSPRTPKGKAKDWSPRSSKRKLMLPSTNSENVEKDKFMKQDLGHATSCFRPWVTCSSPIACNSLGVTTGMSLLDVSPIHVAVGHHTKEFEGVAKPLRLVYDDPYQFADESPKRQVVDDSMMALLDSPKASPMNEEELNCYLSMNDGIVSFSDTSDNRSALETDRESESMQDLILNKIGDVVDSKPWLSLGQTKGAPSMTRSLVRSLFTAEELKNGSLTGKCGQILDPFRILKIRDTVSRTYGFCNSDEEPVWKECRTSIVQMLRSNRRKIKAAATAVAVN